jgi:5-methylcytosine-specific restriction enzyme subunit McrC
MRTVVVREYARLTTDIVEASLDQATITSSAFEWLTNLAANFNKAGASLLQLENRRWLRLDNYVGVVETPCGTLLEILPKHTDAMGENATEQSRKLLIKMLAVGLDLPQRATNSSEIETFKHPLIEWVMKQFVFSLDHLIKRGLRFDYMRVEEEQRYLHGQLNINKQLRQPVGREHIFNIRHDKFQANRPENRLLKSALMRVCQTTQQSDTWRLSHELAGLIAEIPESNDFLSDFRQWRKDRLMVHYQPIKSWCELVLGQQMPLALRGKTGGISLLFPMEKLFERYVEISLRKHLHAPYAIKAQAASQSLCEHNNKKMFQLRPDLLITNVDEIVLLLDTKWKRINEADITNKYGLSQSDFYQMFAYGHTYLNKVGELLLIYPLTESFSEALLPFTFSENLRLWVVPFDLDNAELYWPAQLTEAFFEELVAN